VPVVHGIAADLSREDEYLRLAIERSIIASIAKKMQSISGIL